MATVHQSRRRFFVTLTAVLGAAIAAGRFLTPRAGSRSKSGKVLLTVPVSEIPQEGALAYREARVAVLRDGGEFYAMSLVCTHLGCTVNVTPDTIVCPCHGSAFDHRGQVLKGPAERPLQRYQVVRQGDNVVIFE